MMIIKRPTNKRSFLIVLILIMANLVFFAVTGDIEIDTLKAKYANDESQFVEVDGMQVHYRDEGKGMPIVLIHGTASSLHTWDDWTSTLKKNYRVIRLDIPAFGLTGPNPSGDYRINAYSNFLNKFLLNLAIDSLYLAGNSLGGNIAWYYASEHPDKVKKLILVDPSGYPRNGEVPWIFKLARTPILNSIIRYITPRSIVEKNLQQVYFDDSKITESLIDRYYDLTLREGNRTAFIDRAKTDMKDDTNKLKKISAPTLIIWGDQDIWIPVSDGKRFTTDIPNAQLKVMENVGHVPMEEKPKESIHLMLDFIKQQNTIL
jgi:pimeloyl-ACP methyl ester carboxylesterase